MRTYSDLFPFVIIAFEKIGAVLNGDNDGPLLGELRLSRECKVYASSKGDNRSCGWLTGVLMVAERTLLDDTVQLLKFGDGMAFELVI